LTIENCFQSFSLKTLQGLTTEKMQDVLSSVTSHLPSDWPLNGLLIIICCYGISIFLFLIVKTFFSFFLVSFWMLFLSLSFNLPCASNCFVFTIFLLIFQSFMSFNLLCKLFNLFCLSIWSVKFSMFCRRLSWYWRRCTDRGNWRHSLPIDNRPWNRFFELKF
jgi:hypothetical protein